MSDVTNKSVSDRLEAIIKYYGMSPNEFARSVGFDRADKIYNVLKGKFNPSFEILAAITNKFVEIDLNWLITGEGNMLKHQTPKEYIQEQGVSNIVSEPKEDITPKVIKYNFKSDYFNINNQLIPLYEIEAAAGLNTLFSNQTDQSPIDYISVPNAPKCDGALFVRGDSMYPILKSGDIVCYKHISNLQDNIRLGETYLLYIDDGDDEYLTIKYVQISDRGKDYVKLVSHNQHHAPKDEHISHIKGLAIIKLSIRYNTIS